MRMPEENPVKKLTLLRPEESRRAGRHKLSGWMEWRRTSGLLVLEVGEKEHYIETAGKKS